MTLKITFIVRPLHIKLHFLNLYTLKCLKMHVCALKILGLAIPMHQGFPQLIFQQEGAVPLQAPLKTAYAFMLQIVRRRYQN